MIMRVYGFSLPHWDVGACLKGGFVLSHLRLQWYFFSGGFQELEMTEGHLINAYQNLKLRLRAVLAIAIKGKRYYLT